MERYDGKTKRDDYIKYGAIALGAAAVIVGLCLLTHFLKKANQKEPDYTVVIGSEEAFSEAMLEQLEGQFADLVGDRNGDGEAVVKVEALRLVDYKAALGAHEAAMEAYADAQEQGLSAELEDTFTNVNMEDDFNRMMLHVVNGDCFLYLLSDQPMGEFRGAATTYCGQEYFLELPADMQDPEEPCRAVLTGAPFLQDLGLEDVPFYGCVLDGGDSREEQFAVEVLRQLLTSGAGIY